MARANGTRATAACPARAFRRAPARAQSPARPLRPTPAHRAPPAPVAASPEVDGTHIPVPAGMRRVSVARAPGRFACGKLRRVAQPRTAQAFGDGFCTAQLRLHAATVGSTHLDLSKNDPRQTLEPRDAGLDCDGKRHLRLALRVRDIAVEDREPRAEVMHACPIAATQPRAPTLETLQRSPRLATVAAAELRDRADGEQPRIVRMNSLGAARRQGVLRNAQRIGVGASDQTQQALGNRRRERHARRDLRRVTSKSREGGVRGGQIAARERGQRPHPRKLQVNAALRRALCRRAPHGLFRRPPGARTARGPGCESQAGCSAPDRSHGFARSLRPGLRESSSPDERPVAAPALGRRPASP